MSTMRDDLESWRLSQYHMDGESATEHDLRCAFHSLRFLKKYHDEIANPWRDFLSPNDRAIAMNGDRVLVKTALAEAVIAHWFGGGFVDDHGDIVAAYRWMPLP